MSVNVSGGSARIYQFPRGGRAALNGRPYNETAPASLSASPRVNEVDCSDSWYHQAAILEAKPVREW